MNKKFNKILALILALSMVFSFGSFGAWADDEIPADQEIVSEDIEEAAEDSEEGSLALMSMELMEEDYVAQVGDTKYESLMEAIDAAYNGGTVTLLKDVTVNRWHQNVWATQDSENLTYSGNRAVTGCDGLIIDGDGHTLTINSIDSGSNGNQMFYGSKNITVKNLIINAASGVSGIGLSSGLIENVTFNMAKKENRAIYTGGKLIEGEHIEIRDCTFNNAEEGAYGIYSNDDGTEKGTIISGNIFNTTRSVVLRSDTQFINNVVNGAKGVTVATGSSAVVRGNYFAATTTSRSINAYPAPQAKYEYNVILGPIELENMEYTVKPDFSGNYWGGAAPENLPEGASYSSYFTEHAAHTPTAEDASLFTLSSLQFAEDVVAAIGVKGYASLAEAVAAVPADGTETTITMVGDVNDELTEDVGSNGAYCKIAKGQNIVLDLNGHSINVKEAVGQADPSTAKSYALFENKGTFTIDDYSEAGSGSILFNHPYYKMYNSAFTAYKYNIARNDISNYGTLVLNKGLIKQDAFEIEGITDGAGTAMYTVDNYAGSSFTMNGGQLYNYFSNAVRVFDNNASETTITFNGGLIEGYNSVWLQYTNNTTLTINGGTFKTTAKNYPDSNTQLYSSSKTSTSLKVVITGGTFYEDVSFYAKNIDLNVTGGTFNEWFEAYDYSGNGFKNAKVLGGDFMDVCLEYILDGDWYWKEAITGGNFKEAPESTYQTSSGTSTRDYPNCIAPGYKVVQIPEDSESAYAGWYAVGEIKSQSTETITEDKDTYTVTTKVLDSNETVLDSSEASVSVASITEDAISDDENLNTKTTDTVSLANIDTKKVAEAAAAEVSGTEGAKSIEVTISLSKTDDTEAQNANLATTFDNAKEVFEVHPIATYVVKDADNQIIENAGGSFKVENEDLKGSFDFKLYLDSTKYNGLAAGSKVTVTHYKDDGNTESWNKLVKEDAQGLYVELSLDSFSHIAVKPAAEGASVSYTVKIADATSGTAVIYPGDSVTMMVSVSGDDFYGGDFTISYNKNAFELGDVSLASGIAQHASKFVPENTDDAVYKLNYNLVNEDARLSDGSTIITLPFTAKSSLSETATYDFKVVSASVNYDTAKDADQASSFVHDQVKVNATKWTVFFDGEAGDTGVKVFDGKAVPETSIPSDSKTGHVFQGWALSTAPNAIVSNIEDIAVTANTTYVPVYEKAQYDVTLSGATGNDKATYQEAYTATISDYDGGNYSYTLSYTVAGGEAKNIAATSAEVVIPAEDVTGALNITVSKVLTGFDVEVYADYVSGYSLVLVKKSASNESSTELIYNYDGGAMYFVNEHTYNEQSSYGAYAILVEGAITEEAARAKVGTTDTAATQLTIGADVNATGLTDSSDLQAAYSGYKVKLDLPAQMAMYLRADLDGSHKLDTTDVGLVNNARTI